ncbi:MAG: DUF2972 domain-containing protein [Helicobacter sp.]|nr:DUF2972 domain-containing protein [Helicobacter sp.]
MQTHKTWYKGSYFGFNQEIKKIKEKYKEIAYIKKELKAFNVKGIDYCFLANFSSKIYSLLQENNKPLLQTLFLNFSFFMQYPNEILEWLNSQEFKEQYSNKNHSYPPLLNPNQLTKDSKNPYPNLSYESISPELAWDLNLPLPPYYGFIYWGSHGSGNTGLATFLRYCGIFECYYEPNIEVKKIYKEYFNRITNFHKKKNLTYLAIRNLIPNQERNKFYSLISCDFSLNLVRDPISSLKHYMTMKRLGKAKREITLHSDMNEVCQNLVRYDGKLGVTPDIERINFWINFRYMCFHDTQLKNALLNAKDSIIVDMSEIVGEKTFHTILKLSKELGFPAPNEKYREKFKENIAKYGALLPLTLVVQAQSINFKLYLLDSVHKIENNIYLTNIAAAITHKIEHCLDITQDLFHQPYFYNGIIICIASKDWEILKQDSKTLQEVRSYLLKFIPRLQQQKEIEDKKKITELQVLDYLREHKDLRIQFKQVLDEHLAYIKSVRPDIVESWKYYQEFEKMCAEID